MPMAVGVAGEGEGVNRYYKKKGVLVQRNAFSLRGRGDKSFTSFFWDGKAQLVENSIITQFGKSVSKKFNNALSAAASLPLIERDEFLGKSSNPFKDNVGNTYYLDRYNSLSKMIKKRFLEAKTKEDKKVRDVLLKANINMETLELSDIGNLLADHISNEFKCKKSTWDDYLNGNKSALTKKQKLGAILFYGKGRCATCHSGSFFSDMEFHSIGTPQGYFGPHSRHRDIGRAGVTNDHIDMFKFRTPPLNGVRDTAPYGHNGSFKTLKDVVIHHINPIDFYIKNRDYYNSDYFKIGKLIQSRSVLLKAIDLNDGEEINKIIEFLKIL